MLERVGSFSLIVVFQYSYNIVVIVCDSFRSFFFVFLEHEEACHEYGMLSSSIHPLISPVD